MSHAPTIGTSRRGAVAYCACGWTYTQRGATVVQATAAHGAHARAALAEATAARVRGPATEDAA